MEHNNVVSGHPKSIGILQVYGLSTGPSDLGCHMSSDHVRRCDAPLRSGVTLM